jgi:hypothetical protein
MPRSMVGLLAAVGTAMPALLALVHVDVVVVIIAACAGAATGSAACLALPPGHQLSSYSKKIAPKVPHE